MTTEATRQRGERVPSAADRRSVVTIRPKSATSLWADIRAIASSVELLWILALRDIQIRYKQSAVGIVWVLLQPILMTAIFTFIFGVIARIPSGDVPYPVFVLAALLLWQYFARIVTEGAASLVANSGIITKVYFPRLLLPLVPVVAAAVDFCLAFLVLVALTLAMGVGIAPTIVLVPVILAATGLLGYVIGLLLAPINALYRDVGIALPFLIQIGMFLSPVIYPLQAVPERFHWLFALNPMATLMEAMRAAILGSPGPGVPAFVVLGVALAVLSWAGLRVFRSLEGSIVDRI